MLLNVIVNLLYMCVCISSNIPASITSIKQLDSELFYHSIVLLLRAINAAQGNTQTVKHPPSLPPGKAARFRITSALSNELKEKGYSGECGYESILYPHENDMRKLLRWLIEKLPKTEEKDNNIHKGATSTSATGTNIHKLILDALNTFSHPSSSSTIGKVSQQRFHILRTCRLHIPHRGDNNDNKDQLAYYRQYQPLLYQQPTYKQSFLASVLELNTYQVVLSAASDKTWQDDTNIDIRSSTSSSSSQINTIILNAFHSEKRNRATITNRRDLSSYALVNTDNRDRFNSSNLFGSSNSTTGIATADLSSAFNRRTQFEQNTEVIAAQIVNEATGTITSINEAGQSLAEREHAEAELIAQREHTLATLNQQSSSYQQTILNMEQTIDQYTKNTRQLDAELSSLMTSIGSLEDAYRVKKRTLDLLPEAIKNEQELSTLVKDSTTRILESATEWEQHRSNLLQRIRLLRQQIQQRKEMAMQKIEAIKNIREEIKKHTEELRIKDNVITTLQQEYDSLPKNVNRYLYIRRIMDIMKNITKQKEQIQTILEDLKKLQKDINILSESSVRSFAIADELVFQSAKTKDPNNPNTSTATSGKDKDNAVNGTTTSNADPLSTAAYKSVVDLRQGFISLVACIEEIGRVQTEIRELSIELNDLESRNTSLNTERVEQDLAQVKKENKQLQSKLQATKS